jgi:hypothetical protein
MKNACGLQAGWLGAQSTFNNGFKKGDWNNPTKVDEYCKYMFGQNYSVNKGEMGAWNWGSGGSSWGICQMDAPAEKDKYACCTMDKASLDTAGCSANGWCAGQQVCKDYMVNTFCKQGTNALLNDYCFKDHKNENAIADLCSTQEHFRNPRCKTFCDAQVGSNTGFAAGCKAAAGTYCAANPMAKECNCITFKDTDDYYDLVAKYSTLNTVSSQCWADVCVNNPVPNWSDSLSTVPAIGSGSCPSQLVLCNQTINLSDAKISSVGSLSQTCESSTARTNIDGDSKQSSESAPTPTPAPAQAPKQGSPVVTEPKTEKTPAPKSSFFSKNKYQLLGGGGLLSLVCCCLLLILLIVFMM